MIRTLTDSVSRFSLLLAGGLAASTLHATTFNTRDAVHHEHWTSLSLALGDEEHFRALEGHSYSDATLSLNFTKGVCDLPWLEVRVDLDERQPETRTVNLVPTDFRVDHDTLHSGMAEFLTERGDSGFYAHFYLDDLPLLIDELRQGETLRLRFTLEPENHWFMTFDLAGANDAIARAERLCLDAR